MPFVSNDLLQALSRDVAALRQQVTDQQHAIDQIQQAATAAINTGLNEIREVVRRGLDKTRESVSDPLVGISNELVAVRNGAQDLARRTDQAQEEFVLALRELHADVLQQPDRQAEDLEQQEPGGQQEPATDAADDGGEVEEVGEDEEVETDNENDDADMAADETETAEAEEFYGLLKKAAGISHATVTANRDTWAFLVEHTAGDRHFRVPGNVTARGGTVDVELAGPSLVAAMTALRNVARNGDDIGTRAIAEYLDDRITQAVKTLTGTSRPASAGEPVTLVIDDRLPRPTPHIQSRSRTTPSPPGRTGSPGSAPSREPRANGGPEAATASWTRRGGQFAVHPAQLSEPRPGPCSEAIRRSRTDEHGRPPLSRTAPTLSDGERTCGPVLAGRRRTPSTASSCPGDTPMAPTPPPHKTRPPRTHHRGID